MKEINSRTNNYIKILSQLNTKRSIKEQGLFLVEGGNLILEAIQSGIVLDLLITDKEMYSIYQVEKTLVTEEIIAKLSNNNTNRGAIAVCRFEPLSVNLNFVNKIVVLENINNPGNLGTIIRSALAFGFDAVLTLGDSVFVYNDKVIRSAQGALFKIPVMQMSNITDSLKEFKPYRFVLSDASLDLETVEIKDKKFALVFGNEANGITDNLLNEWKGKDIKINIKNIESLNLSVAAGIALNKFKQ